MAGNMEANHLNWEYALHDVRDIVCKHLQLEELYNMAKVSKSWCDATLREADKRCYIQQLLLSYEFDNPSKLETPPLVSMLRNFCTSILIYDSKLERSYALSNRNANSSKTLLEDKLIEHFKCKVPHQTILLISACKYFCTEDVESEGTNGQHKQKLRNNKLLGLFFPSINQRACVEVAWMKNCSCPSPDGDWFSKNFDFNGSERPKSTILLFIGSDMGYKIAQRFLEKLQTSIQAGNETIWAGIFEGKLNAYNNHHQCHKPMPSILIMRITGSSVESWSAVINSRLSRQKIERKLYELKEKVRSRRHCTGLLYGPLEHCKINELMCSLKHIFPGIPFVGLFNREVSMHLNKKLASCLDADTHMSLLDKLYDRSRYMSIIIISYD